MSENTINIPDSLIKPIAPLKLNIPEELKAKAMRYVNVPKPDSPVQLGIDETMDGIDFGIKVANAIIYAYQDGKLSITDLQYFLSPAIAAPKFFAGIDKIPMELADLTLEEKNQIVEKVKTELAITSDKAQRIVEKALNLAYGIYDLVSEILTEEQV